LTPALLWFLLVQPPPPTRPLRYAFTLGWIAGAVTMLGAFYWIIGLLQDFARLPLVACVVLYLLLCAWGGVGWGFACAVTRFVAPRGVAALLFLPAALVVTERFVPQIFPWPIAISQYELLPVIQLAELGGPYLVTFLVCLVGVAVTETARGWHRAALIGGAALAVVVAYGFVRMEQVEAVRGRARRRTVALIQPNVSIEDKHDPAKFRENVRRHQRLSMEAERRGADLVVWPESSYPYRLSRRVTGEDEIVRRVRLGFDADLVFGAVSLDRRTGAHWNSTYLLRRDGVLVGPADKRILLAFGEYIPLYGVLPFLRSAFPRSGGFTRGAKPQILDDGTIRLGIMNCYEDVLPEMGLELATRSPHLLVNVTNDAWFGDSSEPHLHAALSVFRAVELRRDLARAVNTGVSSFVDATGRVVAATGTFEERVLVREVALLQGKTVYTVIGDAFAWACLVGVVIASSRQGLSRRGGKQSSAPDRRASPASWE
ncbi:MAG: apolipoprotein N-acyltransferase, partial [Actinobacteria bacterium]|nr:apolipoprotein N-acyltransferase [Actinomycetota bacterium]